MKSALTQVLKKTLILIIFICFSCAKDTDLFNELIANNNETAQSIETKDVVSNTEILLTSTLTPKEDAYVQGSAGFDTDIVRIDGNSRKSYFIFDLSSIKGEILEAEIEFTISQDSGYGTIELHKGQNTNWTEENLNSSNAPVNNGLLGTVQVEDSDSGFIIFLNQDELNSGLITFILSQTKGDDLAVSSKENIFDVQPKLTISYMWSLENEETPIAETPTEETPQTETPTEETPTEETPTEETPTEQTPQPETPAEETPAEETPAEETPAEETPAEETPAEETPVEETPTKETPESETPVPETGSGNNYYISINGSNTNNGLSEATAFRSIQRGIDFAQPGDIVWVKAGSYGNPNLFTRRDGTSSDPISIIGYRSSPGDISSQNSSTFSYQDLLNNGNTLDGATDMPYLDNNMLDPDPSDRAFKFNHSYITVKNFKIEAYDYGGDVDVQVTGVKIINVFCNKIGNWDPSNPGYNQVFSGVEPAGNLNGHGFRFTNCDDCEITNSTVVNAGHVGVKLTSCIGGSYNNIAIYSTESGNATDYNFLLYGTSNTTVTNLTSYREDLDEGMMHQGRGYVLQCNSYGNVLDGANITNTRLVVFQGASSNVLKNVNIQGNGSITDGAVLVGDASSNNLFYNFRIDNCNAIQFYGTRGVQCGFTGDESAGDNNFFVNFVVTRPPNNEGFITFDEYDPNNNAPVGKAYIIGGTFHDSYYAISSRRANTELYIINTTFSNITQGFDYAPEGVKTNKIFLNCNFYDVNFTPPSGTNITTLNPLFNNSTNGDFTLQSNSPLLDIGLDAAKYLQSANIDFNNVARPKGNGWSVGAYE